MDPLTKSPNPHKSKLDGYGEQARLEKLGFTRDPRKVHDPAYIPTAGGGLGTSHNRSFSMRGSANDRSVL